jgi:hypothetical protein
LQEPSTPRTRLESHGGLNYAEVRRFWERNYAWQRERGGEPGRPTTRPAGPADGGFIYSPKALAGKLWQNLGQKVLVSSSNTAVPARAAEALGVRFQTGNNDVRFSVVDEAQYRTLMQMGAARAKGTAPFDVASHKQDAIVGTDALLANHWRANVRFGGDAGNTLDINDNPIDLPHEKYILIDNDGYLTAVRAGAMQHWTESPREERLVEVPEEIDVPRVGQRIKLEKTLVKPTDPLVLRVEYTWR